MLDGIRTYILIAVVAAILLRAVTKRRRGSLPPGPRGYPLIGNLFDIPKGYDALSWAKHKDLYGPISSVSALGSCIIILNDLKIAVDLFDKKSSTYSDRPSTVFCNEMVGWGRTTAMLQYHDESFKLSRKYMSQSIGSKNAIKNFNHVLELETRRLLSCILDRPQGLQNHIRTWAGATILSITYGYNIKRDGDDPLINIIDQAIREFSMSAQPGAWLVDMIPALRYLPDWLPGTNFKRIARRWHETAVDTTERPFAFVKSGIAAGTAVESFTTQLLGERLSKEEEEVVKWSAEGVYGGGADTTVSTLYGFFLAMILNPAIQKKAQAELDSVVGPDRLPTFSDREHLPYVNAIVKEILRWNTALHLGIPHVASEDGMYGGYFIPKGAILIPNLWLFNHDPQNFHDPATFKPERFLGMNGRAPEIDPHDITFGFGRRICPGKELGDSSLFIAIAMSLAVIDIRKFVDENGVENIPPMKWTNDVVSHPLEYKCQITPRSAKAKVLIENVHEEYPLPVSDAETLSTLRY